MPVEGRSEYCCAGCEYVHRLITGQKLDRFYELRRGAGTPARSVVFQARDFRWLEGLVKRAETHPTALASGPPLSRGELTRSLLEEGGPRASVVEGFFRPAGPIEATLDLDVQGISCVGCVWLIDRLWRERAGTRSIRINATVGRLRLSWIPGNCDVRAAAEELQRFGYVVGPATKTVRTESNRLLLRLGLCAAFAMNGMLFSLPAYLGMAPDFPFARLFIFLSFAFATASVVVGGTHFFRRSWQSVRRGVLHIDLPISLGILVGYAGSIYAWSQAAGRFTYFDFVSTFTFLMLVGRWTQLAAVERNRHRLLGLRQELPDVELVDVGPDLASGPQVHANGPDTRSEPALNHRAITTKPALALVRGDRFMIAPGQIVPVSSTLLDSAGSLGLDWISGESEARTVFPGQIVESGAINLSPHALRVEALEAWPTSLLARLFSAPTPAEWRNQTLEQVIRIYLLAVIAVAVIGGIAWFVTTGDVMATLQVVVSVLVVSCPCAIGVTLPLIDEIAVARLRDIGVFVRSETLWPRLRRIRKVIFDKTGTLTLESLALRNPEALRALAPDARAVLWRLVRSARHPAASCVREAMLAGGMVDWGGDAPPGGPQRSESDGADGRLVHFDTLVGGRALPPFEVREEAGFGLEWRDERGRWWRLGRESWVFHVGPDLPSGLHGHANGTDTGSALTTAADLAFGRDGRIVARFTTTEEVRDDAVSEVAKLRGRGLSVFILSGDRVEKVAAMARRLELPSEAAAAGMTPDAKAAWVRKLDAGDTLMIGDGANDSLAFDAAACRGTPAIERGMLEHRADFYFLGRGLAGIGRLFDAAAQRRRSMRHVLTFAIVYNVGVVVVALAGAMNPLLAAALMPASALVSLGIAVCGMRRHRPA